MKRDWRHLALGVVCDVVNGGTPKTRVPEYWGGSNLWITPAEMGRRQSPFVDDTERKITDAGLRDSSARMLPPHSVILSSRAPIGHLVINTKPMSTNQGCKGLVPKRELNYKFLYYYLSSIVDELNALGSGTTFMELSGSKLKAVPVPIAPLAEQERIVELLDEATAGITAARNDAERNLQNARDVFEAHLHSVFTKRDATHVVRRLEEVCTDITVGHVGSMAKEYRPEGVPFLRSQNIRPFRVSLDNMVFIDEAFNQSLVKSQLRPGDVAVVRTGYPGTAAVIPESLPISNCSDLVIVRPGREADGGYLALFFNSRLGKELVAGQLVGTAQKHFNVTAAKHVAISFPELSEQRALVDKMQAFGEETKRLESVYGDKVAELDALREAVLDKAFSGSF